VYIQNLFPTRITRSMSRSLHQVVDKVLDKVSSNQHNPANTPLRYNWNWNVFFDVDIEGVGNICCPVPTSEAYLLCKLNPGECFNS
jgi:hypothetical protein